MATEYRASEELDNLVQMVIEKYEEFSDLVDTVRIGCQYSSQKKESAGKITFADTTKVSDKYKQFLHLDFIITFYEPNCEELTPEEMERLMFHELLHVGYDPGNGKMFIAPHDLEDFRLCIEKWGLDWI